MFVILKNNIPNRLDAPATVDMMNALSMLMPFGELLYV
ncbi:hypothetical protein LDG_5445 [Legionella drancourtii LLAP12]|uniref:Uncharacterized protein n=1 Tax=Legionella drancourtii LLAP12 TaxID=658187 RepID=G9EJS9_9GAMM|nr:hypothetical protein LDG_5445 [Legionella drancourtii LLAP12]